MSAQSRVSVVMPVYNREEFVRRAIESALATGYGNLEIVVADDGSTDATRDILDELAESHPNSVRVVETPGRRNLGPKVAANLAIEAASGDYLCFLDSDDVMLPHRFEVAVPLLDGDPSLDGVVETLEVVFADEADRRRWGDRPPRYGPRVPHIAPESFLEAWLLDRRCSIQTMNFLVRRRLFASSGVYRPSRALSEDYHLFLRMVASGRFAVGEAERPIGRYVRHAENRWMPDRRDSLRDVEVLRDVWRWARRAPHVSARNVGVLEEAYRRKARWCLGELRAEDDRVGLIRLAARLVVADPVWAVDRGLLGNLGRGLVGGGPGSRGAG